MRVRPRHKRPAPPPPPPPRPRPAPKPLDFRPVLAALPGILAERDQKVADATVAALRDAGWLRSPTAGVLKTIIRDEGGRISGIVEHPATIEETMP